MGISDPILQDYVALALVVLKSKPPNIEVADYIQVLRSSITSRKDGKPSTSRLFDTGRLWHSLFSLSQRQITYLRAELAAFHAGGEGNITDKPKSTVVEKENATSLHKWTSLETPIAIVDNLTQAETEGLNKDRTLLLRVIWSLAQKSNGKPEHNNSLVDLISLACNAVSHSIIHVNDRTLSRKSENSESLVLNEVCCATKQIWSLLISRIHSTTTQHVFAIDSDLIGPYLCQIVRRFIGLLHEYCLQEAQANLRVSNRDVNTKILGMETMSERATAGQDIFEYNCGLLTFTLGHMMSTINKLKDTQEAVFEDVTSIFLRHLGSLMALHLFDHTDAATLGKRYDPSADYDSVSPYTVAYTSLGTKLEAPYLVSILKSLRRLRSETEVSNDAIAYDISGEALDKLQRMLLDGIFRDVDETLLPVHDTNCIVEGKRKLRTQMSSETTEDENDWFLSQVWYELGWDILLKNDFDNFSRM